MRAANCDPAQHKSPPPGIRFELDLTRFGSGRAVAFGVRGVAGPRRAVSYAGDIMTKGGSQKVSVTPRLLRLLRSTESFFDRHSRSPKRSESFHIRAQP